MHCPLLVSTNLIICHFISCTRSCSVKCSGHYGCWGYIMLWDYRCQTAGELRTSSRSTEVGTWMCSGQENRSSRWGVPLAVVLLARASCHSLGLSLGSSSPLSQQKKPISILGLLFWWLEHETCTHESAYKEQTWWTINPEFLLCSCRPKTHLACVFERSQSVFCQ